MAPVLEEIAWSSYRDLAWSGRPLFLDPVFVDSNRDKAKDLRFLHLRGPGGQTWSAFPVDLAADRASLTFSASFTHFGLPALDVLEIVDVAALLADWVSKQGLPGTITLPPRAYAPWVSPLSFGLRAHGFVSESLALCGLLTIEQLREQEGWSRAHRKSVRVLGRRSLVVDAATRPESLERVHRYYASKGREMSVSWGRLLTYVEAGLPVRIFEVVDEDRPLFSIVFYEFGSVWLYMFAGRAAEVRESPMAWFLAQVPELPEARGLSAIDLGATGSSEPGFDLHGHPVLRFKRQLAPIWDPRETLVLRP